MELNKIFEFGWNLLLLKSKSGLRAVTMEALGELKVEYIEENLNEIPDLIKQVVRDLEEISISHSTILELKEWLNRYQNYLSGTQNIYFLDFDDENRKDIVEKLKKFYQILIDRHPVWCDRIQRELSEIKVKRLYTNTLINPNKTQKGASSFFSQEIWNKMNDLEKNDLEDGCACILVEAWTPAAMILMRSIESGLRSYYSKITKKDPSGANWGSLLKELKGNSMSNKSLLGHFDYLRTHRNRLQHPEARFIQPETEDVLNQSIHIFNSIYI